MTRIAILVSGRHGRGSNMRSVAMACAEGRIPGEIVLVAGNYAESPALALAQDLGLPVRSIPAPGRKAAAAEESLYGETLCAALESVQPDLICLAGYIRKVPFVVVQTYPGKIMNIHNALLPAFGGLGMFGLHVHQAALDYGVKISGCTVHFVDDGYDTGPIILQTPVPVMEDDTAETLAARVLAAEHQTLPEAVALFAQGRLHVDGRRVRIS